MKVLIVGGAGYIGGTTAHLFKEAGHEVIVLDNLSTGHKRNIPDFEHYVGDAGDAELLQKIFGAHNFDIVLDFAAQIQVGESMSKPKQYYTNNTLETLTLIDAATAAKVKGFILSSTGSLYGPQKVQPIDENALPNPINPYSTSKLLCEMLLHSYEQTHQLNWVAFRYFNVAGAYHHIGPDYSFKSMLLPNILDAQRGDQPIRIHGTDYPTRDGTCVRDYIHVVDIASAHVKAAEKMAVGEVFCHPYNLGSGQGSTVLEMLDAVERISGHPVKRILGGRRDGDAGVNIASNELAKKTFGWRPKHPLDDMVRDVLQWESSRAQ